MAKYDPQRPKPRSQVSVEEPSPVDALLDKGTTSDVARSMTQIEVDTAVTEHVATEPVVTEPEVLDRVEAEPVVADPIEVDPAVVGVSEVPVALPPQEGTANRAILGAVAAGAIATLLAWFWLKRRKSH